MKDFSRYNKALNFAVEGYKGHTRKGGGIPYIIHPLRITTILKSVGFSEFEDEDLFIAALFHDLVEDTETTSKQIENHFGETIASIVEELTITDKGRKEAWLKNMVNASKVVEYIMSNYNTSSHTFMDSYAYRYLDTDFIQKFYHY